MKKFTILMLFLWAFSSCSVDRVELDLQERFLHEQNAVVEIEGCETTIHSFENFGQIEVINDEDSIYISILAFNDNTLTDTRLHIAGDIEGFPTVGQGNLPPGKMEHHRVFEQGVDSYTFSFHLSEFGESIYVASFSEFQEEGGSESLWAGDQDVKSGNWSFFEYVIQECVDPCAEVDAGKDNSKTITLSEARAIESWDEVRKLYANMMDEGVDNTQWYAYDPSIDDIIDAFNAEDGGVGEYTTEYTITEGECSDSVLLTLIVVPDPE